MVAPGHEEWAPTRWETQQGRIEQATARIDYAVATGSEAGAWRQKHRLQAHEQREGGKVKWAVSDHAYMSYTRRVEMTSAHDATRACPAEGVAGSGSGTSQRPAFSQEIFRQSTDHRSRRTFRGVQKDLPQLPAGIIRGRSGQWSLRHV